MHLSRSWFEAQAPAFSEPDACKLADRLYGLNATARNLYAERDRNFRLDCDDGNRYILKIANADTPVSSLQFQNRVITQLGASNPNLPVAKIIPSKHGKAIERTQEIDGERYLVRLMTWLEGECLDPSQLTERDKVQLGVCLASMDVTLLDISADGAPADLPWDLCNLPRLSELVPAIKNDSHRALAHEWFQTFLQETAPALPGLPRQLIHNDLNDGNVVFREGKNREISGIIDFGDMVQAPVICELAIACAYQIKSVTDPIADFLPLVSGYHGVSRLQSPQLALLKELVTGRLMTTLLIQGWRADYMDDPGGELRENANSARMKIKAMKQQDPVECLDRLLAACP